MGRKKRSRRQHQNNESLTTTSFVHNNNHKKRKRQVRNVFVSDSIDTNLATFVGGDSNKLGKEYYSAENSHWFHENLNENYFDILSTKNNDDNKHLMIQVKSNWLTHIYSVKKKDFKDNEQSRCIVNTEIKEEIACFKTSLQELKHQFRPIIVAAQKTPNKNDETTSNNNNNNNNVESNVNWDIFSVARKRANPMECLGEKKQKHQYQYNPFINRSAMKLANMDALLQYSLTKVNSSKKFVFVDLCGAPGGFTEYLIHRTKKNINRPCQGYGMSLQGMNSNGKGLPWRIFPKKWKHNRNFHICKGTTTDGNGDVYKWDNILYLKHKIHTVDKNVGGVDLVLADGGFDAQRDQEDQEQITLPLIICQIAASLALLQENGNFVLKVFGFQHRTTRHIITYLMKHLFDQTIFLKPIISRPASSERYMVCLGYRRNHPNVSEIYDWRQQMLATLSSHDSTSTGENCKTQKMNDFDSLNCYSETCMDLMDRDMLLLNIQACKAILSELKNLTENDVHKTTTMESNHKEKEEEEEIDGNLYKEAWEIDQLFVS